MDELVVGGFDGTQRLDQQVGVIALAARDAGAGQIVQLVGVLGVVPRWLPSKPWPMAQNGSGSPGMKGWRITGTDDPGMWSSTARPSGAGRLVMPAMGSGMVDQRERLVRVELGDEEQPRSWASALVAGHSSAP